MLKGIVYPKRCRIKEGNKAFASEAAYR
jgi:hypothetical protein